MQAASIFNYRTLLSEDDAQAFKDALRQSMAFDLDQWLSTYGASLGTPTAIVDPLTNTLTSIAMTYSNPYQDPVDEPIYYTRLDLGAYLSCCLRYLTADDITSLDTLCAWFQAKHGLYFTPAKLAMSVVSPDPIRVDRQLIQVSVVDGNYVWVGQVTLYVVAADHLALRAYPGLAKGLQWSDVLPTP